MTTLTNEREMKNVALRYKNVVLLCECGFTRSGLETLLRQETCIFSTADVEQCRLHLSSSLDSEVDLVILSARRCGVSALARLALLIQRIHPSCRVLMDPGSASIPLLRFYLNCLNAPVGLIDFTQSVPNLRDTIVQVLWGETVPSAQQINVGERLSSRERHVLLAVMKELKQHDIAGSLSLSVKTVSHYKRTGLRKLGARNLQDLLLPSVGGYPRVSGAMRLHNISDALAYQYAATG